MEKINIYRRKLAKSQEIELKQDLIVPDSKQDIFQILDENFYCYLSKIEIENGRIKVSGDVDAYISYISSGDETSVLQTTLNINDVFENSSITDKMNLEYKIKIARQDIKIINERKINITVILNIYYEVFGVDSIEIFDDFNEIEDIQINSSKLSLNSIIDIKSSIANLKEELKIENSDIISDILRVDTNILNKEVKISYNKILTKADFIIKVIYLTTDGRIGKTEEKFPIMSFIDLENIKEENVCNTDYQIRNILMNINNGDDNSITIQMEYEIFCKAFEVKEQEIVSDLYSLKYETEFENKEIEVTDELSAENAKNVEISEKIELNNAKNIIDVFGKSKIIKKSISNNISNIEGEVELKIYYELENKIGLNVKVITIPFISKINTNEELKCDLENIEFDLNGNMAVINGIIIISESNLPKKKIKIVQDITKKVPLNRDNYGMIVYSIKKDDTLWNVSKKFKVKKENIINSNGLEEPYKLKDGEKLYIIR